MVTQSTNYVTGDAAFAVDRRGVIVLWNPAAEKTFGYSASKAIGQKCWRLLCGQDTYNNKYCCKHCALREMAFQNESVNGFEASFITASDGRKAFSISCLLVFDKPGNELLMHICRPQKETHERGNNHVAAVLSAQNFGGNLTRRETEALTLLADGKSTQKIATEMGISTSTVRNHIQHVLRKLKVNNRLEAVMLGNHLDLPRRVGD